jgi:osmotically-inducible protein OsmY
MELERNRSIDAAKVALMETIEARVRQSTHNRIRNLSVEEVQGRFVVGGQVASQHMKQLALHGALEVLGSEQFASKIVVNSSFDRSPILS